MQVERIPGCNLVLGEPENWDVEKHGECGALPVVQVSDGFLSQWKPTTEELVALFAGAPIFLKVFGGAHPPVCLMVGPVPTLTEMKAGSTEQ